MPRTADTTGTRACLIAMLVRWKLATMCSKSSNLPSFSRPSAPFRSAPAENGSPVCQITTALSFSSASLIACWMPSSTWSLTVFILVLNEMMPTPSSPSVHRRMPSFSHTVVPVSNFSPRIGSGNSWRWYTGCCERGLSALALAEYEPSLPCTPLRPSVTQAGRGALLIALPALMSSLIHSAICCQPAACQVSNGPSFQP